MEHWKDEQFKFKRDIFFLEMILHEIILSRSHIP